MTDEFELKEIDGRIIKTLPLKKLKLIRGGKKVLEKLPLYVDERGDWHVELELIQPYLKKGD